MASKRKPIRAAVNDLPNMNFRANGPDVSRRDAKGKRPTAEPTSVQEILTTMIIYVCKKAIFFDTNIKVALYLGSLFLISLIGDFLPFPKTYLARSDNIFNVYFVKIGWGWTLLLTSPYILLTSYTLSCGDMKKTLQRNFPRIFIATFFWYFWTTFFNIIGRSYGRCNTKGFISKSSCLKAGHLWQGFDISGHAFILIYSSLVLIEEARPIINWELIKDHLRNELHNRNSTENTGPNPLRYLSREQIRSLKVLYDKFTPIIKTLFIGITAMQLLWDVMLVGTMLYYHHMVEKVISGCIAVLTWYFTYRFWYQSRVLPDAPGSGSFFYQRLSCESQEFKRSTSVPSASSVTSGPSSSAGVPAAAKPIPTFMGMPLYTKPRDQASSVTVSNEIES